MSQSTKALIERYYDVFNRADFPTFFALMTDDVKHDINQSGTEIGKGKFREFIERMNNCYQERIENIQIMVNEKGDRAAAEYVVNGVYKNTDAGLPEAKNQIYKLSGGAFFEIKGGKIARVTNYYNLQEWLKQIET